MRTCMLLLLALIFNAVSAQTPITTFERSSGKETTTYADCIAFYQQLDRQSPKVLLKTGDTTDAGFPLHLVLVSGDGKFSIQDWHRQHKIIIMFNNGIHPGEPDGIDASMMIVRDIVTGKKNLPANVVLAIVPVYNIGGALNRGSFSRVNQQGPLAYGFRGNAQNLDLNRDFTKSDSKNARAFAKFFHALDPEILVDNHVSDGADYQHTMTLISTQWNKLGGTLGTLLHDRFTPALFQHMEQSGWPMCPYVNFEDGDPGRGWTAFYDPPRYSSGYGALFQTLSFIPETHMLKPFADRVKSTYALEEAFIAAASAQASEILAARSADRTSIMQQKQLSLDWTPDSTRFDELNFSGYETGTKTSEVTGMPRLFYDHDKPFTKKVKLYNYFTSTKQVTVPAAYVIPQGWWAVTELLRLNGVQMEQLKTDSTLSITAYHIDGYQASPRAYEKHHRNVNVRLSSNTQSITFHAGDWIVNTNQKNRRFIVEMLEPPGDDSYFAWNFFDAVLQQKEGYSDYRWEDIAATFLREHDDVRKMLEQRRLSDTAFAKNASAQLYFVYQHSPWNEPAYLRYPVFRIENK
jgi:hypothetical protein